MKKPATVKSLEEFGRVRLSKNFFMRDFFHSEISQIEGIPNIPDYPDIAIQAGTQLCEQILEPIQNHFGRISIRSAYRSPAVNAKGAENKNQYNCSRNDANYSGHIWDQLFSYSTFHRPTNHSSRKKIDNNGKIQPTFMCFYISNIGHPRLVWSRWIELSG